MTLLLKLIHKLKLFDQIIERRQPFYIVDYYWSILEKIAIFHLLTSQRITEDDKEILFRTILYI